MSGATLMAYREKDLGIRMSGDFEFAKARITAAGELILTGTVCLPEGGNAVSASFVVVGRKTQIETIFPAEWSEGRQPLEVTGRIPLQALELEGETLANVYFVSDGSDRENRARVVWDPEAVHWLPYPTKFGNLSLKRMES
ncbi:hypothetical protein D477_005101 [Arthrobacter crystallopoietes BAB-32]|uniref:Uncharacterized protein n=1 Tax=Arthrobacter crystallopoietes BAB-32 TaxID=1246476 RepID=N1VAC7_9MICC|nr:hypothetical protein [Arthrobacter crystallopoietes]EMY35238.1 hypothetical protein D477_005101 [Arthrobacter crystallopoietes BAB-32]